MHRVNRTDHLSSFKLSQEAALCLPNSHSLSLPYVQLQFPVSGSMLTRRLPLPFLDLLLTRGGQWNMSRSLVRFPERLIWKVLLFGFILPTSCCWTQMWRLYGSSYIVTWRCLWEWKPRTKNGETERQKEPECLIIWNCRAIPELPNLRFILWEREPRSLLRFQLCAGGDVHK